MSSNPHRNEVEWVVNGRPYILRLSLGDLAAIDNREPGNDGCMALVSRIREMRYGVGDIALVLLRALKTGSRITLKMDDVLELIEEAGWSEATNIVIDVLSKRLGKEEPEPPTPNGEDHSPLSSRETPIGSN
jgi:hypothetical protein